MIEIVCPSCGAQYQVPVDSIGPEGRKVTCSSCSHKWRAYAPAAAADPASEAPAESPAEPTIALTGEPYAERESPAATGADESAAPAAEAHEPSGAGEEATGEAQPATAGREEQMDAIRRMLDDLKRSAENEPEPEPEPEAPRRPGPEPTMRRRDDEDTGDEDTGVQDTGGDPLRSRIRQLEGGAQPGRPGNYDAARLRKMHERRARRLQKAKERQRKSGAFLTGFTLVAAVTATMVGLYALHPQIIAASPEIEPAMNEYVVTVDRYRIALDEATADWRDWMGERVAQLSGGQEGQAGQAQEPTATE